MAATLAHELRTPLTAITGFAAVLRERLAGRPKDVELAGKIERGVSDLETVTRRLLSFTETPELSKRRVRLCDIVDSALEMLPADDRGAVSLLPDGAGGSLSVDGDALQLRQAILNLVRNACEAAGENGSVRITLRRKGDEAQVEVEDNGPGVPQDLGTRVFLPFFTTKRGGTGLGLAYSEKLVRAHGGQITLDGGPGKGAVFTIRLPLPDREYDGKRADAGAEPLGSGAGIHGGRAGEALPRAEDRSGVTIEESV
jgi:signal transduction histidine kinase